MRIRTLIAAILVVSAAFVVVDARSEEIRVAVATNFRSTLDELATVFESESDSELAIISGSTGLLYAQIRNGAPFDLLLAADQDRPRLLGRDGFGNPSSVFTFAVGRLALWSVDTNLINADTLPRIGDKSFRWLAIAEPKIAPYGIAARETLEHFGYWQSLQPRIVTAHNVGQAFALIGTGNADLGFVALSQVRAQHGESSFVIVPREAHAEIRQDAIILNRGAERAAVAEFVRFLQSARATTLIEQSGYEVALLRGRLLGGDRE